MKKFILRTVAIAAVIAAFASTASAQYYNRDYHRYRPNEVLVAPLVGGVIVGTVLSEPPPAVVYAPPAVVYAPPPVVCSQEFAYYDRWNHPVYREVCR
jgi:hypothetical protein